MALVEPLEAVEAADTEPWFELDRRAVSGEDCNGKMANVKTVSRATPCIDSLLN